VWAASIATVRPYVITYSSRGRRLLHRRGTLRLAVTVRSPRITPKNTLVAVFDR
jgi:hypothetical protein